MGQPLHPYCRVFRWTPRLPELPLWRHLHPSALLALPVVHTLAFTKPHPHTSTRGQERIQNPGYFHLPQTILRWRLWGAFCRSRFMLVQQRFGSSYWIPELFAALWLLSTAPASSSTISVRIFVTWSFHVGHCGSLPYQNAVCNVQHRMNPRWGWFADRLEVKKPLSSWSRTDNHQPLCWSGATSGSHLLLAWHTSMGFVGRGHVRVWGNRPEFSLSLTTGSNETGDSFTELEGER